jgi:hypothetical protein
VWPCRGLAAQSQPSARPDGRLTIHRAASEGTDRLEIFNRELRARHTIDSAYNRKDARRAATSAVKIRRPAFEPDVTAHAVADPLDRR